MTDATCVLRALYVLHTLCVTEISHAMWGLYDPLLGEGVSLFSHEPVSFAHTPLTGYFNSRTCQQTFGLFEYKIPC